MTKSKCIDKNGNVVRISLHPNDRKAMWYGDTFERRVKVIKAQGLTIKNRSMS